MSVQILWLEMIAQRELQTCRLTLQIVQHALESGYSKNKLSALVAQSQLWTRIDSNQGDKVVAQCSGRPGSAFS